MRRPSGKTPYPYHLLLSHPEVGTARLLLATDQSGALVTRHRHTGLEGVTPTDYNYGSQSPFTRKTATFNRLVMGMGQPVEEGPNTQRYDHAMGMDWSCGLGALATAWATPIQVGTGPIKSIVNQRFGGVPHLFILSGDTLFDSTAGTITLPAHFTPLRTFGTPTTPPTPTLVSMVGTGSRTLRYRLATKGNTTAGAGDPGGPPFSAAGLPLVVNSAPDTLADPTAVVNLSWPLFHPGTKVVLYRSVDNITWYQQTIGVDATTYTDTLDATWTTVATPPTVAVGQTPYQLATGSVQGRARLWIGMEEGGFWAWDGTTWTQAVTDGRALAAEGGHLMRAGVVGVGPSAPPPGTMNWAYDTVLEPTTLTAASTSWVTVYSDERAAPITRLVRLGGTPFTLTETRISVGTIPNTTELSPDRGFPANPHNGRTACVWMGAVYTTFGMGLYRMVPTGPNSASIEAVGMERLIENNAPVQGRITALGPWGAWHLFWGAWNERNNTGYVGKFGAWLNPEQANQPTASMVPVMHGALESWVGHKPYWLQSSVVGEPSGNGRMYLGFEDGYLTWTVLPGQTPFAPTDPNCRFRTTGYTILSRHAAGFQADDKTFFDLTAVGPQVNPHQRVRFVYVLPDGSEHEIPGEVTEGGEPLVFPEGAVGKWVQIKVIVETDDPASSPVVEGLALGEKVNPSYIEEIAFTAHVGPRLLRRDGHVTRASAKELHDLLRQLGAKGDDVRVLLPDGQEERAAIVDFTDRYLEGGTTMGPRHDMSLSLLTFKTVS